MSPNPSLFVNEIFNSISGEVGCIPQGTMATFIRFQGCNLNCGFCDAGDTRRVSAKGTRMDIGKIITQIENYKSKNIVLTGGEPFVQDHNHLFRLITILEHYDYKISIETNGSFEIPFPIIEMCGIVMDFKLDAKDRMLPLHFLMLKRTDFVKFLIRDQQQMDVAIEIIKTLRKDGLQAQVAFSPILPFGPDLDRAYLLSEIESKSEIIIEGIRKMGNEGILNLQLHKLIGVE